MRTLLMVPLLMFAGFAAAQPSLITGFELGTLAESSVSTSTGAVQGTVRRSGSYAYRANPTAPNPAAQTVVFMSRSAGGVERQIFKSSRFYIQIAVLPASGSVSIVKIGGSGTFNPEVELNSDGTLNLADTQNVSIARSVNAVTADSLWHRVEFDVGLGLRVYVDGVLWASGGSIAYPPGVAISFGAGQGPSSAIPACDLYFDDILVDQGAYQANGLPGDGRAVLLSSVVAPVGGTYALSTYSSAGITGTVTATMPIIRDEQTGRGKMNGSVASSFNPVDVGWSFDFGDGLLSVFTTHYDRVYANPPVTLALSPSVTVTTSSKSQIVSFVGLYADVR